MTDRTCVPLSTASTPAVTSASALRTALHAGRQSSMSAADVATHEVGSHVRVSPEVQRAVARYETAALRLKELAGLHAHYMTGAQFDSLALAQDTMTESRRLLERTGDLHLIDASAPVPGIAPEVLRLRMQMRAADYNPDLPHQVEALACVAGIDTGRLAAVLVGRAPLDWRIRRGSLAAALGVEAVA